MLLFASNNSENDVYNFGTEVSMGHGHILCFYRLNTRPGPMIFFAAGYPDIAIL